MKQKEYFIEHLKLQKHVEGGWYAKTYASDITINDKSIASSIYFLLDDTNFSAYHKLTSDEIWYYHYGSSLHVSMIDLEGTLHDIKIGPNLDEGEVLQYTVPKEWIFASYVETGFSVVGCMVAPGFTYDDFKLYSYPELVDRYPQHQSMIRKLTR
ncbi:cupin domain-containing protein [Erysipelothrix anatis]|uniref:cupin domain-containing protein n=1 Tax=Erysipelothrix anatis TaxID=2683713 RepID=UPI00135CBFB3|nr:cupin domain-containing protein [Erysipelothrix anatis]